MSLPPQSVTALVLAGRRSSAIPDAVAAAGNRPVKALVEILGRTMLERVFSTLRATPAVGAVYVSLPVDVDLRSGYPNLARELATGGLKRITSAGSPSASVREFVGPRVEREIVLATTADHPLLTPEMVDAFLREFDASGAEAAVALTKADRIAALYPQSRRTKLALSDGRFTGCNLFAFRGSGAMRILECWKRVEQHRKHPWRIAHMLGWGTLGLYLLGRLSLVGAIARLSRRSGTRLHAILLQDPHAGIDVDSTGDLQLVTSILAKRENGVSPGT